MIHLFINALAASAGAGLTYVRNVVPHLALRDDVKATILLDPRLRRELQDSPNLEFLERDSFAKVPRRFWFEQRAMPDLIQDSRANVLLSAGNFALWRSPVPQILLSGNSLYTSRDFFSDLRARNEYRLWIDTQLKAVFAKWSIAAADCVVAPSEAFAAELRRWTGKPVAAIHHGFDRDFFVRDQSSLPDTIRQKLDSSVPGLRLLFVSHYNYYRNFETLMRALPMIKEKIKPRPVRLLLTCRLAAGESPGAYRPGSAAALVRQLGLAEEVVELGSVPYHFLHRVYGAAHMYVTPAYTETFAHPLVEAMSSGLPVVASDLPVHREICGSAAVYFDRFSAQELAQRVLELAESPELAARLSRVGVERSTDFSWSKHVDQIISVAARLVSKAS
jgi:glycosyltransferase involved in cell wall biosynthesis